MEGRAIATNSRLSSMSGTKKPIRNRLNGFQWPINWGVYPFIWCIKCEFMSCDVCMTMYIVY